MTRLSVTWRPSEEFLKKMSVLLKLTPDEVLTKIPDFVKFTNHRDIVHLNPDVACFNYVARGLQMASQRVNKERLQMRSANEGFHEAPAEFSRNYDERGYAQYHIDKPSTWKCPCGKTLIP